jgi:flagellar hook protein FlgE
MPDSEFSSTASLDDGESTTLTSGTLLFDSSGNLAKIDGKDAGVPTTEHPNLVESTSFDVTELEDGATLGSSGSVTWNLYSSSGSGILTQTSSASSNTSATPDGYTAGTYESFTVDTDGTISASYSNGETVTVGQVALATVANEQGLTAEGSSLYKVSTSSGTASVGTAGSGSLGTIKDSALEDSNVDISTEFSQLIIAQRAFQANSKSITTFDSVTETAIGMIRS